MLGDAKPEGGGREKVKHRGRFLLSHDSGEDGRLQREWENLCGLSPELVSIFKNYLEQHRVTKQL